MYNATIHLLPQDSTYDSATHTLTLVYQSRGTMCYSHHDAISLAMASLANGGSPKIILYGGRQMFNSDQLAALDASGIMLESRPLPGQPGDVDEPVTEWFFDPPMDGSGWITRNGVQQVQAGWQLYYKTGHNSVGDPAYDWGLPEALYRWDAFLPPDEHDLFLNEHGRCYKIFAMHRPWWITMLAPDMFLENGVYAVTLEYVDDCYTGEGPGKEPPTDPLSFEARVLLGNQAQEWQPSDFLSKNTVSGRFVHYGGRTSVGFEMRARWPIKNPCAFVRSLRLVRVG